LNIISENAKRIVSGDGAQKRLGQNFILDMNITRKIVSFAHIDHQDSVLEIGPGPGGLTLAIIAKQPKYLVVIEKDRRCLPGLEGLVHQHRGECAVDIMPGDALAIIPRVLHETPAGEPLIIIANLPYNIASPLLVQFINQHRHIKEMVLMFQKEVAQRIVATPGSKHYGRLSIVTQAFFKPTIVYHLAPSVFTPAPKVDSAVVHFTPLMTTQKIPIKQLEYVTHIFFSSRRKTVGNIIKNYLGDNEAAQAILAPYVQLRPENLAINIYIQVALTIKN
jgi:16S rRNA (adenine1518-N6/adenine1519-N6)-dimethyltransferase